MAGGETREDVGSTGSTSELAAARDARRESVVVRAVRMFNRISPWHHPKYGLTKRAARWANRGGGRRLVRNLPNGLAMQLDLADWPDWAFYMDRYEPVVTARVLRLLRPGDVFIDGGANAGFLTLPAAQRVGAHGRVIAFEPSAATAARLREHVRLNDARQVQVIEAGLWHEPGEARLHHYDREGDVEHSLQPHDRFDVTGSESVRLNRLDDVLAEHAVSGVRLLKLDVEGAELPALRGAERTLTTDPLPHLIVEMNPRTCAAFGYSAADLLDWLRQRRPHDRLHVLSPKRERRSTPEQLICDLEALGGRYRDVWFEPPPASGS